MTPAAYCSGGLLYCIVVKTCYFLVPDKKVTKEAGIGEALSRLLSSALRAGLTPGCALHAPAGAATIEATRPYKPHPARNAMTFQHLNDRNF